jgi:hypothetical protein
MADDEDAEVEGELEVIKSIYAQDWVEVGGGKPNADQRMFAYTLSPLEDDVNLDVDKLTVRFILPQGYPSKSPPIFESGRLRGLLGVFAHLFHISMRTVHRHHALVVC